MMRLSLLIVGAACAALAGCAATPYRAKVPDLAGACAGAWGQLQTVVPYVPTDKQPEATPQEFADHAGCLGPPALPARGSVLLYDLRTLGRPAELQVNLLIETGGTMAGSVDLLDGDFHVVRHQGFDAFIRRGGAYTLAVFLHGDRPRYLALTPDSAFVGKQLASIGSQGSAVPVSTMYGSFIVASGEETHHSIPLMAGGLVGVTVMAGSSPTSVPVASSR